MIEELARSFPEILTEDDLLIMLRIDWSVAYRYRCADRIDADLMFCLSDDTADKIQRAKTNDK